MGIRAHFSTSEFLNSDVLLITKVQYCRIRGVMSGALMCDSVTARMVRTMSRAVGDYCGGY